MRLGAIIGDSIVDVEHLDSTRLECSLHFTEGSYAKFRILTLDIEEIKP